MRPAEMAHRISEQLLLKRMQVVYWWNGGRSPKINAGWDQFAFCAAKSPQLPQLPWSFCCDQDVINGSFQGTVGALGYEWSWRDRPGVWHEAPDTGRRWPKRFFGSIPYRAGNPYGDIRVAWEPSRLQHLIDLALIAEEAGDQQQAEKAIRLLERQFLTWCEDNPPWCGIHYISAMECGLRLMAVGHALDRARQRLDDLSAVWVRYAQMVEHHAGLIEKRLSLHSSIGNHTVAECAGLVYAGLLFPEFKGAARWLARGLAILESEADHQILADGGGVEQAFWYHLFVLDLYGLVLELLSKKRRSVPQVMVAAVERGRRFLGAFGDGPADLPPVGDSDSGFALSRYLRLSWIRPPVSRAGLMTFSDTGYSIIHRSDPSGLDILMDHGPLGMAPAYGHGHADALAVVLRRDGGDLATDPGTYTYTGDPQWRSYFRSTRAHNTVCVDGLDQSQQETAFLWSRPFQSRLHKAVVREDGTIVLLACHDGYRRIGVVHWRSVIRMPTGTIWILDYLKGDGVHELELNWHIDGQLAWRDKGGIAELTSGATTIRMQGGAGLRIKEGAVNPITGWKSTKYGVKQPITTITCEYRGKLPHEFITLVGRQGETDGAVLDENVILEIRGWTDEA